MDSLLAYLIKNIYNFFSPSSEILSTIISTYYLSASLLFVSVVHFYSNLKDADVWKYNKLKILLSFFYFIISMFFFAGLQNLALLCLVVIIMFRAMLDIESTAMKKKYFNCIKKCTLKEINEVH